MKKLVMTVAVLACASSVFSADTVTSANIVGYNKATSTDSNGGTQLGLQINAVQFVGGDTTVEGTYGAMPGNTKVYKFNPPPGTGYQIATYTDFGGGVGFWANGAIDLSGNIGHWVEIPAGAGSIETIISGEVEQAGSVTNSLVTGLQMLSYPYPVEKTVELLGLTPADQDKVFIYNGTGYTIATYTDFGGGMGFWANGGVSIPVGIGFWYESNGANYDWIVSETF